MSAEPAKPCRRVQPRGPGRHRVRRYTTAQPQALGQVLETMGFRPIARHRSREVLLYRQGPDERHRQRPLPPRRCPARRRTPCRPIRRRRACACATPARRTGRAIERGAWGVPGAGRADGSCTSRPSTAVGTTRLYFVRPMEGRGCQWLLSAPGAPGPQRSGRRVLHLRRRLRPDPDRRPRAARRSRACTGSASCSTSATSAPRTGPSFYRELLGFSVLP
jgi:hypothetical protein